MLLHLHMLWNHMMWGLENLHNPLFFLTILYRNKEVTYSLSLSTTWIVMCIKKYILFRYNPSLLSNYDTYRSYYNLMTDSNTGAQGGQTTDP